MTTTVSFVKAEGYVYGNLGNGGGVIELGRFRSTAAKVSLMNMFRGSGFKVTCVGDDLMVTKEVA